MKTKRRVIYGGVIVSLLMFLLILQHGIAISAEKSVANMKPTLWRVQCVATQEHFVFQALLRFSKEVATRTGDKLKVEVYPSGGMGIPVPKTISAVRDGLMNMGEVLGAFTHGEFPLSDVMEVPGLVPWNIELRKEIIKALAPHYVKVLPQKYNQYWLGGYQNDFRGIALHNKKVDTLDSLKGLKIRASGPNEVDICKAIGVAPVSIATPETYSAMAMGTVDGCFGADSWFSSGKFWEVAKYVYSMEFDGHQMHWTINKDDFDALPQDVQGIVREAAAHAIDWVWGQVTIEQKSGRQNMISHGVKYFDITPEDWARLVGAGDPIVKDWVRNGGPVAQEMVDITRKVVADWSAKKK